MLLQHHVALCRDASELCPSILPEISFSVLQLSPISPFSAGLIPFHTQKDVTTHSFFSRVFSCLIIGSFPPNQKQAFFSPTLRPLLAAWSCKQWSHFSSQHFLKVFLMHRLLFLPHPLNQKGPLGYFMLLTPLKLLLLRLLMPSTSPSHGEWVHSLFDLSNALDRLEGIAQLVDHLPKIKLKKKKTGSIPSTSRDNTLL